MWSQLARLKLRTAINGRRTIMNPKSLGPLEVILEGTSNQMKLLGPEEKHWYIGGDRSIATAITLLKDGEIIAVPTDTIYGFAGCVENDKAIKRLYEIKKRDEKKPLAICVSGVHDVKEWGVTEDLPPNLIENLLPGPYTFVLKKTEKLNPALNPGFSNVGIRIPDDKFIRSIAKLVGPLALTSANESNTPSSVHPDEFSHLWPELGGIFYKRSNYKHFHKSQRMGSTVIDLSQAGYYKILRVGVGFQMCIKWLHNCGLKPLDD